MKTDDLGPFWLLPKLYCNSIISTICIWEINIFQNKSWLHWFILLSDIVAFLFWFLTQWLACRGVEFFIICSWRQNWLYLVILCVFLCIHLTTSVLIMCIQYTLKGRHSPFSIYRESSFHSYIVCCVSLRRWNVTGN